MLKNLFWDKHYHRLRLVPRVIVQFIVLALVFLPVRTLVQMIRVPLLSSLLKFNTSEALALWENRDYREISSIFNSLLSFATLLVFIVALLIISKFVDKRPVSDFFGKLNKTWFKEFAVGLLIGGLPQVMIGIIAVLAGWIKVIAFFEAGTDDAPFGIAFISMILFFICAALNEEIQFRGYGIRTLTEGFSRWGLVASILMSVFLTSVLFGLAHATNPNISWPIKIGIILGGVWMALGYVLTRSIALPFGMHLAWNVVQFLFGFPVSGLDFGAGIVAWEQGIYNGWIGTQFGPESGYLSLIGSVLGIVGLLFYVRSRYGRLSICEDILQPGGDVVLNDSEQAVAK